MLYKICAQDACPPVIRLGADINLFDFNRIFMKNLVSKLVLKSYIMFAEHRLRERE